MTEGSNHSNNFSQSIGQRAPDFHVLLLGESHESLAPIASVLESMGASCTLAFDVSTAASQRAPGSDGQFDLVAVNLALFGDEFLDGSVRILFPDPVVLFGFHEDPTTCAATYIVQGFDLVSAYSTGVGDLRRALTLAERLRRIGDPEIRRRFRNMVALNHLATGHRGESDLQQWITSLLAVGQVMLGCSAIAIWVHKQEDDSLYRLGSVSLSSDYARHFEQQSQGQASRLMQIPIDTPHTYVDLSDSERPGRILEPGVAEYYDLHYVALQPVRESNRIYGFMSIYFQDTDSVESYDISLADTLASIAAANITHDQLTRVARRADLLYRELVDHDPNGVLVCKSDGTIELANTAMARLSGRSVDDLQGSHVEELVRSQEDLPWEQWQKLEEEIKVKDATFPLKRSDGRWLLVRCRARRIEIPSESYHQGNLTRLQLLFEDITIQHHRIVELEMLHDLTRKMTDRMPIESVLDSLAEKMFQEFRYRFVGFSTLSEDGSYHIPRNFRTYGAVPNFARIQTNEGITGRAIRENRAVLVSDVRNDPDYVQLDPEVTSELAGVFRRNGKPFGILNIETDENHVLDENDLEIVSNVCMHVSLLLDQAQASEHLELQALTDPLTGCANRRAFIQTLQSLVEDRRERSFILFIIELDHFKLVNDHHGHLFGDEMLKQVCQRLTGELRSGDLLARYGGDELAALFLNAGIGEVVSIAQRLRSVIADTPFEHEGKYVELTVSIGIAVFPVHGSTPDDLIGEADRAMYQAKRGGRNMIYGNVAGFN